MTADRPLRPRRATIHYLVVFLIVFAAVLIVAALTTDSMYSLQLLLGLFAVFGAITIALVSLTAWLVYRHDPPRAPLVYLGLIPAAVIVIGTLALFAVGSQGQQPSGIVFAITIVIVAPPVIALLLTSLGLWLWRFIRRTPAPATPPAAPPAAS